MSDNTQDELHKFLSNPENLKRAAEGSMKKRQALIDRVYNTQAELDEILTRLENMVEGFTIRRIRGNTRDMVSPRSIHAEAKQAITSLIKELVAEAKPEIPVATSWQQGIEKKAFEDAIRVYEYKLLKALEEL